MANKNRIAPNSLAVQELSLVSGPCEGALSTGTVGLFCEAMDGFLIGVASAVAAGWILWMLGVGRNVKVSVHGASARKSGKIIVLIAWAFILFGLYTGGHSSLPQGGWDMANHYAVYGVSLLVLGFILLVIGSVVAWFQKN